VLYDLVILLCSALLLIHRSFTIFTIPSYHWLLTRFCTRLLLFFLPLEVFIEYSGNMTRTILTISFLLFLLLFCDPASYSGLVMYLNALTGTVCLAASPPSGNQLISSSLCLIPSLEQTRLKTFCFICISILSSLSTTNQVFVAPRVYSASTHVLLPLLMTSNYPYFRVNLFLGHHNLGCHILLRLQSILQPVCSCVTSVFHFCV
jgi:hypothetical protein